MRKAGLNIMMSMKGDGKPVSFIEDCAVPLEHLAEYTERLTRVFEKHGTRGTWYAHASVGTLHVRPVLDMRRDGAEKMRAIAEEACAMVKEYKGAYSGEHGDGLVRSEWIAPFFGPRLTARSPRSSPGSTRGAHEPGQDRQPVAHGRPEPVPLQARLCERGSAGGPRLERVGRLRQGGGDVQQQRPLPQVRRRHHVPVVPRDPGRSSSHPRARQYAAAGAFKPIGFEEVKDALELCVSCKGCKRECPTGVDMARMKIEFLAHYKESTAGARATGDRLPASLCRVGRAACASIEFHLR